MYFTIGGKEYNLNSYEEIRRFVTDAGLSGTYESKRITGKMGLEAGKEMELLSFNIDQYDDMHFKKYRKIINDEIGIKIEYETMYGEAQPTYTD